jgi:hypothetical protein
MCGNPPDRRTVVEIGSRWTTGSRFRDTACESRHTE